MISLVLNVILVLVVIVLAVSWPKTVVISDVAPENKTPKNLWLQLQNEGAPYVKVKDGKVILKIVK